MSILYKTPADIVFSDVSGCFIYTMMKEYHFFVISIELITYILTGDTIEIFKPMGSQTIIHSMYPIRLRNYRSVSYTHLI